MFSSSILASCLATATQMRNVLGVKAPNAASCLTDVFLGNVLKQSYYPVSRKPYGILAAKRAAAKRRNVMRNKKAHR